MCDLENNLINKEYQKKGNNQGCRKVVITIVWYYIAGS